MVIAPGDRFTSSVRESESFMHIGLSVYGTTFGMGIDPHAGRPTITPSQLMDKAISVGLEGVELPISLMQGEDATAVARYAQERGLQILADLGRSKSERIAENALLRQQLIILKRQVRRPPVTRTDRILLVLLARVGRDWQQALVIVQPDTLLRGPRELLRLVWKHK